ncbi:hypothetical protein BKA81DRAFT_148237 [Phyllosticta paracitricarpa]
MRRPRRLWLGSREKVSGFWWTRLRKARVWRSRIHLSKPQALGGSKRRVGASTRAPLSSSSPTASWTEAEEESIAHTCAVRSIAGKRKTGCIHERGMRSRGGRIGQGTSSLAVEQRREEKENTCPACAEMSAYCHLRSHSLLITALVNVIPCLSSKCSRPRKGNPDAS